MPRAPSGLSLLLMAGLAFAATSPPSSQQQQLGFVVTSTSTSALTSKTSSSSSTALSSSLLSSSSSLASSITRLTSNTTTTKTKIQNNSSSSSSWPSTTTSDLQSVAGFWAVCSNTAAAGDGPLCPPPCLANSNKSTQCLYYLKESHKEEVCGPNLGPERRRIVLHGLRMRHCCEHAVDAALPHEAFRGGNDCRRLIDDLLAVDELARRISCSHHEVLTRYDCGQTYSIAHHCSDCKQAYRRWVCSSLVPHFSRAGERIRPCLSVCQDVEQQCPYLLPGDWTNQTIPPGEAAHPTPQYAGEPTFLCLDPNIPETGEQKLKSLRGDEDCCYTHCGTPGRGGGRAGSDDDVLSVCEHCPGRPAITNETSSSFLTTTIIGTTSTTTTSISTIPTTTSAAAATTAAEIVPLLYWRAGGRTLNNKVSLLWTAWIIYYNIELTRTILNTSLQCLLVLCASCVRTTLLMMWTILMKIIIGIKLKKIKLLKTIQCGTCS